MPISRGIGYLCCNKELQQVIQKNAVVAARPD
jgi:hypothetical protein